MHTSVLPVFLCSHEFSTGCLVSSTVIYTHWYACIQQPDLWCYLSILLFLVSLLSPPASVSLLLSFLLARLQSHLHLPMASLYLSAQSLTPSLPSLSPSILSFPALARLHPLSPSLSISSLSSMTLTSSSLVLSFSLPAYPWLFSPVSFSHPFPCLPLTPLFPLLFLSPSNLPRDASSWSRLCTAVPLCSPLPILRSSQLFVAFLHMIPLPCFLSVYMSSS